MPRGEHTSIVCSASGSNVEIYWMSDQSIIPSNLLNLDTKTQKFHEKNYTCVAENAFGKDSRSVYVRIIGERVIVSDMYEVSN